MTGLIPLERPRLNRRFVMVGGVTFALFGSSRGGAWAQEATPAAQPTGDEVAVALLTNAATAMTELDSFAFSVVTARGETTILEGLELEQIQGVVRRPTDFQTTVTVAIPFATLELTAVSVDGELWIELPDIGQGQGGWQQLGASSELLSLLNPDVLILQAVPYIENAMIADEGDIDGVPVTYVTGTVDFQQIATDAAGDQQPLPTQVAEGPVELSIAVDDESLVREIEIIGPLLATEADNVIRLVTFSDFNEPVEIERPEAGT